MSEAPLQVRVVNVQREINTIRAQIVTKTTECSTLRTQRKTAQMNACAQQLTALRQTETVKKKELTVAKESLKKVAGAPAVIAIPVPAPTPAPAVTLQNTETPGPAPALQSAPELVTTVTLVSTDNCCYDTNASNYDATCIAPRNHAPALCTYPTQTVICQDSSAHNFMQEGECVLNIQLPGCMSMGATNYNQNARIDDGSCQYAATMS